MSNKTCINHQMTWVSKLKTLCPKMSLSQIETKRLHLYEVPLDVHTRLPHNGHLEPTRHIHKWPSIHACPKIGEKTSQWPHWPAYSTDTMFASDQTFHPLKGPNSSFMANNSSHGKQLPPTIHNLLGAHIRLIRHTLTAHGIISAFYRRHLSLTAQNRLL